MIVFAVILYKKPELSENRINRGISTGPVAKRPLLIPPSFTMPLKELPENCTIKEHVYLEVIPGHIS